MTIRDATRVDLPGIVAIYNSAIPGRMATADTEAVSIESRLSWFHDHTSERRPLWVAEAMDGSIAGWLSFQSFYGRPAYHATAEVSVYVAAEHRRRGVGWELLAHGIDRAPLLGVSTLIGYIFAHNSPSLRLFERAGFQRWGHLPGVAELDGVERDLVIVGRRLTE